MSSQENIIKYSDEFDEKGFCLVNQVLSEDLCNDIRSYLSKLTPKVCLPFSNIPWGYGNLLGVGPFVSVTDNDFISRFCQKNLGPDHEFNHLMVANKAPWIGSEVEWHQEVFNIDTYAPGWSAECDWKRLIQVYIAIDEQNLENGCLKVIPGSHCEGVLKHEDVINDKLRHKRRVPSDVLDDLHKKYGIKNVLMNPGDVLFFNHRLVHGSGSNKSHMNRKSIILQARQKIEKDDDILSREVSYRKNFVIDYLKNEVDKLADRNVYNDFKKGDKK